MFLKYSQLFVENTKYKNITPKIEINKSGRNGPVNNARGIKQYVRTEKLIRIFLNLLN